MNNQNNQCQFGLLRTIETLCKHAAEKNKILVMNLSAPFLIKYFTDKKMNILQYVDVLFGNQDEAAALAKVCGIQ